MKRLDVGIIASFSPIGVVMPKVIVWADGRRFEIDQVKDMRKAASTKAGGFGMRYTCRIREKIFYLFREDDVWFMEVE